MVRPARAARQSPTPRQDLRQGNLAWLVLRSGSTRCHGGRDWSHNLQRRSRAPIGASGWRGVLGSPARVEVSREGDQNRARKEAEGGSAYAFFVRGDSGYLGSRGSGRPVMRMAAGIRIFWGCSLTGRTRWETPENSWTEPDWRAASRREYFRYTEPSPNRLRSHKEAVRSLPHAQSLAVMPPCPSHDVPSSRTQATTACIDPRTPTPPTGASHWRPFSRK